LMARHELELGERQYPVAVQGDVPKAVERSWMTAPDL